MPLPLLIILSAFGAWVLTMIYIQFYHWFEPHPPRSRHYRPPRQPQGGYYQYHQYHQPSNYLPAPKSPGPEGDYYVTYEEYENDQGRQHSRRNY